MPHEDRTQRKQPEECMKPAPDIIQLQSVTHRCNSQHRFLLNGSCLVLINLLCGISAMAGPADSKEIKSAPAPAKVKDWEPGDPLSFADGMGTFDVQIRERFQVRHGRQKHSWDS